MRLLSILLLVMGCASAPVVPSEPTKISLADLFRQAAIAEKHACYNAFARSSGRLIYPDPVDICQFAYRAALKGGRSDWRKYVP